MIELSQPARDLLWILSTENPHMRYNPLCESFEVNGAPRLLLEEISPSYIKQNVYTCIAGSYEFSHTWQSEEQTYEEFDDDY